MQPLGLMARLAALVPPPRMRLGRYHGVFELRSLLRAVVTARIEGFGATLSRRVESAAPAVVKLRQPR